MDADDDDENAYHMAMLDDVANNDDDPATEQYHHQYYSSPAAAASASASAAAAVHNNNNLDSNAAVQLEVVFRRQADIDALRNQTTATLVSHTGGGGGSVPFPRRGAFCDPRTDPGVCYGVQPAPESMTIADAIRALDGGDIEISNLFRDIEDMRGVWCSVDETYGGDVDGMPKVMGYDARITVALVLGHAELSAAFEKAKEKYESMSDRTMRQVGVHSYFFFHSEFANRGTNNDLYALIASLFNDEIKRWTHYKTQLVTLVPVFILAERCKQLESLLNDLGQSIQQIVNHREAFFSALNCKLGPQRPFVLQSHTAVSLIDGLCDQMTAVTASKKRKQAEKNNDGNGGGGVSVSDRGSFLQQQQQREKANANARLKIIQRVNSMLSPIHEFTAIPKYGYGMTGGVPMAPVERRSIYDSVNMGKAALCAMALQIADTALNTRDGTTSTSTSAASAAGNDLDNEFDFIGNDNNGGGDDDDDINLDESASMVSGQRRGGRGGRGGRGRGRGVRGGGGGDSVCKTLRSLMARKSDIGFFVDEFTPDQTQAAMMTWFMLYIQRMGFFMHYENVTDSQTREITATYVAYVRSMRGGKQSNSHFARALLSGVSSDSRKATLVNAPETIASIENIVRQCISHGQIELISNSLIEANIKAIRMQCPHYVSWPALIPNRYIFAGRNGTFDTLNCKWTRIGEDPDRVVYPGGTLPHACNYIDADFELHMLQAHYALDDIMQSWTLSKQCIPRKQPVVVVARPPPPPPPPAPPVRPLQQQQDKPGNNKPEKPTWTAFFASKNNNPRDNDLLAEHANVILSNNAVLDEFEHASTDVEVQTRRRTAAAAATAAAHVTISNDDDNDDDIDLNDDDESTTTLRRQGLLPKVTLQDCVNALHDGMTLLPHSYASDARAKLAQRRSTFSAWLCQPKSKSGLPSSFIEDCWMRWVQSTLNEVDRMILFQLGLDRGDGFNSFGDDADIPVRGMTVFDAYFAHFLFLLMFSTYLYRRGCSGRSNPRAIFLTGQAGTGKTKIVEIFMKIFPTEYVSVVAAAAEQAFGASNHAHSWVIIAPELTTASDMLSSTFLSFCTDKQVQMPVKNRQQIMVDLPGKMIAATNVLPKWADAGNANDEGAIGRRQFVFRFFRAFGDRKLEDHEADEAITNGIGSILVRCSFINKLFCSLWKDDWYKKSIYYSHIIDQTKSGHEATRQFCQANFRELKGGMLSSLDVTFMLAAYYKMNRVNSSDRGSITLDSIGEFFATHFKNIARIAGTDTELWRRATVKYMSINHTRVPNFDDGRGGGRGGGGGGGSAEGGGGLTVTEVNPCDHIVDTYNENNPFRGWRGVVANWSAAKTNLGINVLFMDQYTNDPNSFNVIAEEPLPPPPPPPQLTSTKETTTAAAAAATQPPTTMLKSSSSKAPSSSTDKSRKVTVSSAATATAAAAAASSSSSTRTFQQ